MTCQRAQLQDQSVDFLTPTLFPRFQSYYSHLQQMEYIAIAPCIKWRAYPGFALDETFPKALLLLTWLIPKCPTAEVQIQSNALLFHDEFILKSPALTKLIHCQKPRFSLPNSSSLVLLCLISDIIKSSAFPLKSHSQKPRFASVGTSQKDLLFLTWLIPNCPIA